jgi:hypothetical protein
MIPQRLRPRQRVEDVPDVRRMVGAGGTRIAAVAVESVTQLARPQGGYQVRPSYPATPRRLGIQGTTLLRVDAWRSIRPAARWSCGRSPPRCAGASSCATPSTRAGRSAPSKCAPAPSRPTRPTSPSRATARSWSPGTRSSSPRSRPWRSRSASRPRDENAAARGAAILGIIWACSLPLPAAQAHAIILESAPAQASPGPAPRRLTPPLGPGACQARGKVMAADGHVNEGTVGFTVVAS